MPFIEDIEPEAKIESGKVILTPAAAELDKSRSGVSIYDAFDLKYIEFKQKIEKERFARELLTRGG
ncbi:MAG: hypothetical protein K8I03_11265 [Ignavibacteria bacterium]|nr:hypothetical protein [Ignavibacteria bacterium]